MMGVVVRLQATSGLTVRESTRDAEPRTLGESRHLRDARQRRQGFDGGRLIADGHYRVDVQCPRLFLHVEELPQLVGRLESVWMRARPI